MDVNTHAGATYGFKLSAQDSRLPKEILELHGSFVNFSNIQNLLAILSSESSAKHTGCIWDVDLPTNTIYVRVTTADRRKEVRRRINKE